MSHATEQSGLPGADVQAKPQHRLLISWVTAALALFCLLPANLIAYGRGYYQGTLRDTPPYLHVDIFLGVLAGTLWLLAIGFVVAALVLSFRRKQGLSAVRFGLTTMTILAAPLLFFARGPAAVHHVEGFRDGLRSMEIDYESIRRWRVASRLPENSIVPAERWPKQAQELEPRYVTINEEGGVELIYSNGTGQWGITVHPNPNEEPRQYNVAPGVDAWFSE